MLGLGLWLGRLGFGNWIVVTEKQGMLGLRSWLVVYGKRSKIIVFSCCARYLLL